MIDAEHAYAEQYHKCQNKVEHQEHNLGCCWFSMPLSHLHFSITTLVKRINNLLGNESCRREYAVHAILKVRAHSCMLYQRKERSERNEDSCRDQRSWLSKDNDGPFSRRSGDSSDNGELVVVCTSCRICSIVGL